MYKRQDTAAHRKSFAFAVRVVKMVQYLRDAKSEYVLSKQVIRSGTAIGALVREAEFAQSDADFISKLSIALKEGNETGYWLQLLHETEYLDEEAYKSISADCSELMAILISTINTMKRNVKLRVKS